MRELLILPLLAFFLHCSWADDPSPVDCHNLVGKKTFDDVKNCKVLKTKPGEQYAVVVIEEVDEKEWKRFSSELEELYSVDFRIMYSNIKMAYFLRLHKVHRTAFNVNDNPVLEEFSLNAEGSDTIYFFAVGISGNSQLKKVNVTAADARKFEINGGALWLIQNKALENIDLPENGVYKDMGIGFHVKGNPQLKKASLDSLRKLSANIQKKYIQDEGECVFIMEEPYKWDIEISDVTELKDCKYVKGDLKVAKGAKESAGSTALISVTGTVYLKDPKEQQISFLSKTKVTGGIECHFDDEVASLRLFLYCTKVTSDLKITGEHKESGADAVLKEVTGSIHLKNPTKGWQFDFLVGITNGGIDCTFDVEVTNLDVFRACPKVIGDLKISGKVSGSGANSVLKEITGNVNLKDPKMEQIDLLNGTTVTGHIVCHFENKIANLAVFKRCQMVDSDLNLTESVTGSAENGHVLKVNGNVDLKHAREEQLGFLNGTNITGQIVSCHLTSLHGVNVTKGNCTSPPPTGGHDGSGGGADLDEDKEENKDSIFKKPWMIATISGVAGLIIILVVAGLLLYFFYFKKRSDNPQTGTNSSTQALKDKNTAVPPGNKMNTEAAPANPNKNTK